VGQKKPSGMKTQQQMLRDRLKGAMGEAKKAPAGKASEAKKKQKK